MPVIRLRNRFPSDVTIISNDFIDQYMVDANGEYVKIYLYILRLSLNSDQDWTLNTISDKLECTTKDVIRALNYWAKKGLLACEYNEDEQLTSLTFLDPAAAFESASSEDLFLDKTDSSAALPSMKMDAKRRSSLSDNPEIKQIIFVAEQYFSHTLSKKDIDTILYFYSELHFSADLLEFLIEHCVDCGGKEIAYIKAVGFAWYKEGITSVAEAKELLKSRSKEYREILNAYGISNRKLSTAEQRYLQSWVKELRFPLEIILAAIDRTMLTIHEPQFSYTDSILQAWKKEGVSRPEDISALDERFARSSAKRQKASSGNYVGRNYDINALERELLEVQ